MVLKSLETEPKYTVNYPSQVRLCGGRLLFGVRKATEFDVVPAVTQFTTMPDIGWQKAVSIIGGGEFATGLDINGKVIEGADKFNVFGFENCVGSEYETAKFTTAVIVGDGSRNIRSIEQIPLTGEDLAALYGHIILSSVNQAERFVPSQVSITWVIPTPE